MSFGVALLVPLVSAVWETGVKGFTRDGDGEDRGIGLTLEYLEVCRYEKPGWGVLGKLIKFQKWDRLQARDFHLASLSCGGTQCS